jgi:hypothetical protein
VKVVERFFYQHFEDVQKGHFAVVSGKITFDYKHVANGKSLEKRLFRHPQDKQ